MSDVAPEALKGVFTPVVTPFRADLSVDPARYLRHCRWLLSQGSGLAVFGTNSEANSLTLGERKMLLETLIEGGVPPGRMMPGTGCNSFAETVELTRHAVERGAGGVLMLPPFYYKGVSDDGLFAYFSEVIERVGDQRLRVYLYHIPPVAQVGISLGLIERLIARYPHAIAGLKDSSGDWTNTKAAIDAFPGFRVFVGSETFLLRAMQAGGVGCISAAANINPARINALFAAWNTPGADAHQAELDGVRGALARHPLIAALKATIASYADDPGWRTVRPPLVGLGEADAATLRADLNALGFTMPAYPAKT